MIRPRRHLARRLAAMLAGVFLLVGFAGLPAANANVSASPYRSPLDGARYVLPSTGLIVRPGGPVSRSSLEASAGFTVFGSRSGTHAGRISLSDDRRAILWKADEPFVAGETVTWRLAAGTRLETGVAVPAVGGTFTVAGPERNRARSLDAAALLREEWAGDEATTGDRAPSRPVSWDPLAAGWARTARADTLPADFPAIYRTVHGTPSAGRIFLANITFTNFQHPSYLMILEDDGTPVFYRRLSGWGLDFKMQPNGRLTYFDNAALKYYALDSAYAVVDSFATGNGYVTDLHELRVLPGGHALLMAYDPEVVDMSQVVAGGDSAASVIGLIIQELDENKNVVFQWRSWDHFQVTDAQHIDLTRPVVDYVHGNALELDTDGNLLLSSRHMDEVTKIDRQTGEILWRLGGLHNEFTFVGDPDGFTHQHAIRKLPNGNITLFDNGNFHTPSSYSRAVEYRLDETARTATLIWQFRNVPDIQASAMGYVQRLDDGNTVIGWGSANPTVTEVNPRGEKVTELTFDAATVSYRAYRFPWYPELAAGAKASLAARFMPPRSHPFRNDGALTIFVRHDTGVTVRMYDVRGRLVRVLLDGVRLGPGEHDVPIDGACLRSGIYYCRVRAEGKSDTRKIVLIR